MDPIKSMAAMFPHLYSGLSASASLSSAAALTASNFPVGVYSASPIISPLLSGLSSDGRYGSSLSPANNSSDRTSSDRSVASPSRLSPPTRNRIQRNQIKVTLDDRDLWQRFNLFGTEMIVTRSGRRMFPILKIKVEGLDRNKKYFIILDIVPLDDARYKFCNGQWAVSGRAEPHFPSRLFVHPDSPSSGKHWMDEGLISFHRVKLTNNNKDQSGNILLNSMHRYQPRVHIAEAEDVYTMNWSNFHTFTFPTTSFFAVTAYQNENITQLKIDNNPFAKGFRDREKVYPQKRSAPFLEQLREAAATTEVKQRRTAASEESQVSSAGNSPIKTELGGSAVVPPSIYSVLSSDSLNMYHNTAKLELLRQQLIRQHDPLPTSSAAQVSNPFFPFNMNKLPMVNLPFSLFQSRPCS